MQQRIDEIMELVEEYHQARQHGTPECKITTRKAILEALGEFAADPAQAVPASMPDAVRAALFAARGALQHLIDDEKPTESLFNAAIQAIDSVALTAAAPGAVAVPDERAAFEAWFLQKGSAHQLERNEAKGWYENAWANAGWEAWQARAALAAAPAAPAPVVMNDGLELIKELVQSDAEKTSLHREFMGKPMPALTYDRFQRLRDERVPALWQQVRALLAGVSAPAAFGDEDHVSVPRSLIGAACAAIDKKRDGVKTLAELRRYTTGDLSAAVPAVQAVVQTPVLYVSKWQLENHRDPDGPESAVAGRYLPARITPAGNFTTPLFELPAATFQVRVQPWLLECFGEMIAGDREERNHRFLEESLELVQSLGCTASEAHQLVDYVYGRPWGEPAQEAGGVMVTLAALCLANGLDMHACGETELARIWTKVEAIRAKQAAKPKHSPLPEAPAADALDATQLATQADARDAAFEAVRKEFCRLQRYSFLLDDDGNVRRVPQFSGNWVEFEAVHTLFEPEAIDAAIAAHAAAKEGARQR